MGTTKQQLAFSPRLHCSWTGIPTSSVSRDAARSASTSSVVMRSCCGRGRHQRVQSARSDGDGSVASHGRRRHCWGGHPPLGAAAPLDGPVHLYAEELIGPDAVELHCFSLQFPGDCSLFPLHDLFPSCVGSPSSSFPSTFFWVKINSMLTPKKVRACIMCLYSYFIVAHLRTLRTDDRSSHHKGL